MRRRVSLPVLIACACSLVAADAASAAQVAKKAGRIEVSRRVEPTLDPYLRTALVKTPLSALTADQKWLSTHARPLVVHDSDPTVSRNLTGWATKPRVSAYYNATGVNTYRPEAMAEASAWLLSEGGAPVFVDGWRALDLRIPAARKWWLYGADGKASCNPNPHQRGALDLYACGYTGLWLDNALTTPKQGFTPTPAIPEAAWAKGVLATLSQLRAKKPKGTTFTINTHWTDTDFGYAAKPRLNKNAPAMKAARYADQVIIEGGAIDRGLHYALGAKVPWSYRRLLAFGDAMHKAKVKVQWEKTGSVDLTTNPTPVSGAPQLAAIPSCSDVDLQAPWKLGDASWSAHVRTAALNYATAMLTFKNGDSVGDMCEYPGRGWRGYETDLGRPSGKRYERNDLVVRKFSKGIVAVNGSDKSKVLRLPSGKRGVDLGRSVWPQTNKRVKAVRLAPRTAAVVKY